MNQHLQQRRPDWKDGRLTISRTSAGDMDNSVISISLEFKGMDRDHWIKVELTPEDFGLAVTGLSFVDVKIKPLASMHTAGSCQQPAAD